MVKKALASLMAMFLVFQGGLAMAEYNVQREKRNVGNTGWDQYYPITKAFDVKANNGKTAESIVQNLSSLSTFQRSNLLLSSQNPANTSSFVNSSGYVSRWIDQTTRLLKAKQDTEECRPVFASDCPTLIDTIKLPDISVGGETGKGFTCTGMAYDASNDCWWVGNAGKMLDGAAGNWQPTIVKLSADFRTKISEINLYTLYPTMNTAAVGTIQGLCFDASDNSLWIASTQESKVHHLTKTGTNLGSFDFSWANGIAYDGRTDTLWILSKTVLTNVNKSGTPIKSFSVAIADQDQLYIDEANGYMYFTAGAVYHGANYIYRVDLDSGEVSKVYNLRESYCVEGLWIDGNRMYVLNDGYHHSGSVNVNQANVYDISRCIDAPQFDGSNDSLYIDSSSMINDLSKITISAVIQPHALGGGSGGYGRIVDKTNGSSGYVVNYRVDQNIEFSQYHTDGLNTYITPLKSNLIGKTSHVVITYDKSSPSNLPLIYINGVGQTLTRLGAYTGTFTSDAAAAFYIGNRAAGDRAFNGFILELGVFNRVLSQAEVAALFEKEAEKYGII